MNVLAYRFGGAILRNVRCSLALIVIVTLLSTLSELHAQEQAPVPIQEQVEALSKKLDDLFLSLDNDLSKANNEQTKIALTKQKALAEQFVHKGDDFIEGKQRLENGLALLAKNANESQKILSEAAKNFEGALHTFSLIEQTVKEEQKAEQIQHDSKMYFKMRVRTEVPPKALKAYGLMDIARQTRDQGDFQEAMALWNQAEILVKESFNDHIAKMAEWREQAKMNAEKKQQDISAKVERLLSDHFVAIPAGSFMMGGSNADEMPVHKVEVAAFSLGKAEVTFELYDLCVENTHCYAVPGDEGWGREDRPVINVSHWDISRRFLPWLNKITGKNYRLPSEAEWEYAARAGSTTEYSWGDNMLCSRARYDGGVTSVCDATQGKNIGTVPVKSYESNALGLYDMHGNVWEWVQDCWSPNYEGAPKDGSAYLEGNCSVRVLRGGAWNYHKTGLRSANRYYFQRKARKPSYGFRLAHDALP